MSLPLTAKQDLIYCSPKEKKSHRPCFNTSGDEELTPNSDTPFHVKTTMIVKVFFFILRQNTTSYSFYFLGLYRKTLTPLPQLDLQVLKEGNDSPYFWANLHLLLLGYYFESFYPFVVFF